VKLNTLAERNAARQRMRDNAIAQADRLGRSLTCQDGTAWNRPDLHERCRGEEPTSSGCLCECHDRREGS
jgi:hypothetical protein